MISTQVFFINFHSGQSLKSLLNTEYGCEKQIAGKIRLQKRDGESGHKFYLGKGKWKKICDI